MAGGDPLEFESVSWHDNAVHGLRLEVGDSERGEWHSRLILDIDHIVEWLCRTDQPWQFRVAPATLTFEGVTDLSIQLPDRGYGPQMLLSPFSIDGIEREEDQRFRPDRPYWRWSIHFNDPNGGVMAFGASGFHLKLRAEPVLTHQQCYPTDRPRPQPF